ncbi:MAG: class III lanthionine synthetase LanKC [Ilumatobacteraceae bacterium]
MNELYERFLVADPTFYDVPAAAADPADGLLATIGRTVPDGWTTTDNGVWLGVHPAGIELPEQGWKIHVSATLDNARRVLTTVWDHCVANGLAFKFLDSAATFLTQNAKYADRGGSGKFVTVYPPDDAALETTLRSLEPQLRGEAGPYVLSDLRYGDGPLYVRYGGFLLQEMRTESGDVVPAIRRPDGTLVPDERRPELHTPSWVTVPDVLASSLAARDAAPAEPFPYDVTSAVHFSNGGGVYVATCRATGETVIVKEARPHAGLDADGVDAVTRLEREHRNLVRLAGLDCVAAVHELRRHWEHTFLVEELVHGPTLNEEMVQRHPLIHPSPSAESIVAYRDWALGIVERLEAAVAAVHRRGVVLGDLHPRNVLLRPDGRICLIDLELAHDVAEQWQRGMGAPAFSAPPSATGFAVDRHALGAIRLWLFLPFTELLTWDPDKADELISWAAQRFGLDDSWAAAVRRDLVPAVPTVPAGWRSPCWPQGSLPRWTALRDSVAAAIAASATPWRDDRLFPGDPEQFASGGLGLAHGAAGVLWALATVGADVDPVHLDWLASHALAPDAAIRPGLYDGLAGIALALSRCGRDDDASAVVERLLATPLDPSDHTLFSGGPGVGLVHLWLAGAGAPGSTLPPPADAPLRHAGRRSAVDHLAAAAGAPGSMPPSPVDAPLRHAGRRSAVGHLAAAAGAPGSMPPSPVDPPLRHAVDAGRWSPVDHLATAAAIASCGLDALAATPGVLPKAGLLRGWSGLALLCVRLAEMAGDPAVRDRWLDAAARALAADLARCSTGPDGTVQFDEGWRMLPYLGTGSAGIGIIVDQYLAHRPDGPLAADLSARLDGIVAAASTDVVVQCGVFNGRAGLVLLLDGARPAHADVVRRHVAHLAWHAVPYAGHVAFAGDQLARLSMDLGTGAAGVLLAIGATTSEQPLGLPFLRPLEGR